MRVAKALLLSPLIGLALAAPAPQESSTTDIAQTTPTSSSASATTGSPIKTSEAVSNSTAPSDVSDASSSPSPVSSTPASDEVASNNGTSVVSSTATSVSSGIISMASVTALGTSQATSSAVTSTTSTARKPLRTANLGYEDLLQCRFPTVEEVGVDEFVINDLLDPNTGDIWDLSPLYWYALKMDEWLDQVVKGCPALASKEAWANGTTYRLPILLGKLMVNPGETIACGDAECQWQGDPSANFPGPTRPPILKGYSNENVTNFRRWYTVSALNQVNQYFKRMQANFDAARVMSNEMLPALVQALDPKPFKSQKGLSNEVLFNILSAAFAFTPIGTEVKNIWHSIQSTEKKNLAREALLAGVEQWKPWTSDNIKGAAKAVISAATPAAAGSKEYYFETSAKFAAGFSLVMRNITSSQAEHWQKAVFGPPAERGGFLDMVRGGAFAGTTVFDPRELQELRNDYTKWIIDTMAVAIWRDKDIFIYKDSWPTQKECMEPRNMRIPGIACYPDPDETSTRWIRYIPFAMEPGIWTENHWEGGWPSRWQDRDWYRGLDSKILKSPFWDMNQKDIYEGSAACFDANNALWYKYGMGPLPPLDLAGLAGSVFPGLKLENTQPNLYTPESAGDGVGSSGYNAKRLCHWNLPVLDADSTSAKRGCKGMWNLCAKRDMARDCPAINNKAIVHRYDWSEQTAGYGNYNFLVYASNLFKGVTKITCDGDH